ncbi:MAG: AI-2E family transporter [Oscillospiraceae bacterium]|nr:AI-2E family transporter [Oscillospiraceae bacterium]
MIFKKFPWWIPALILGFFLIMFSQTFLPVLETIVGWIVRLFSMLVPFFIGGIIAYLLYPPCKKVEELYSRVKVKFIKKRARGFAVITVYLAVIGLIALVVRIVSPAIYQSIEDLITRWPAMYEQFIEFLNRFDFLDTYDITQNFSAENIMNMLNLENILVFTQGVLSFSLAVLSMFIGIVVSIYILLDRDSLYGLIHRSAHLYIKPKFLNPVVKYTRKINEFLHKYIYCQLLDSLILGTLSFIGLSIIGVRYALISALLLGLFNIIPYFGSIIATAIAILLALMADGTTVALATGIFLLILQQVDANIIQPRLASNSLNLRPFWIILAILIGGGFFGIWGMFLAPPLAAVIKIIVKDILANREKRLDKSSGETTHE